MLLSAHNKIFSFSRVRYFLLTACKTGIFDNFGYARNWTSVNKNPILRPLYNIYVCHITVFKWSPNCTRTLFMICFVIELVSHWNPHCNFNWISSYEGVELSSWNLLWILITPIDTNKRIGQGIEMIFTQIYTPYLPNATPPIGKIHPSSKIAVTFIPMMQFWLPLIFIMS